ncbi:MAG: hypothetical protein KatS3mg012_1142 [Gaiellaceae bacterium]|nr:MAG: hypothetical protein KatS3mg012_1142 [Gaiellaceae bacterium]
MAALAGLEPVAHGGLAGAVVESLVVLAVGGVFAAIWLRERRARRARGGARRGELRDDGSER